MIQRKQSSFILACVASIVVILGGCTSGGKGREGWSSQRAWHALESDRSSGALADDLIGGVFRRQTDFEHSNDEYWAQAEVAIRSDAPTEAIDEMVDELAQRLANDLPNIPEIQQSEYQVVLVIGDVGSTANNPLMENMLNGIEARLRRNTAITDSFMLITSDLEDADAVIENISGDTRDFEAADQRGDSAGFTRYDPQYVYQLKGSLSRLDDEPNHKMTFTLFLRFNHLVQRRQVESYEFRRPYYWQPFARRWLSEAEEMRRRGIEQGAGS